MIASILKTVILFHSTVWRKTINTFCVIIIKIPNERKTSTEILILSQEQMNNCNYIKTLFQNYLFTTEDFSKIEEKQ